MRFNIHVFVLFALIATAAVGAPAATQLTSLDVANLKAICASLVGKSALDISTAAGERGILEPYLEWFHGDANPGRMIVRCADVCTATLRLRGGAELEFVWPNQSKRLSELHVKSARLRIHRANSLCGAAVAHEALSVFVIPSGVEESLTISDRKHQEMSRLPASAALRRDERST